MTTRTSWDDKIAKLRGRKPAELSATFPDTEAEQDLITARLQLRAARRRAEVKTAVAVLEPDAKQEAVEADPDVAAARETVVAAEERAAAEAFVWTFRALPPDVYDEFAADHPPTPVEAERGQEYHVRTYLPAILSACSVEPIDVDTVAKLLWGDPDGKTEDEQRPAFNQGEVRVLAETVRDVNQKPQVVLGKASPRTRS